MRVGIAAANVWERLHGRSFRVYLHSPSAILEVASARGLALTGHHRGLVWEFAGLERVAG